MYVSQFSIEAESRSEAIKKILEGEGEFLEDTVKYLRCVHPECWTVKEKRNRDGAGRLSH